MAEMSAESIQQRIQIARRDAEALKDRIKRKKDELADTTRKLLHCKLSGRSKNPLLSIDCLSEPFEPLTSICSQGSRTTTCRPAPQISNEDETYPQRPSCQDLCHALVH